MREIDRDAIMVHLSAHDLPCDDACVDQIWRLLHARLIEVDAPPVNIRSDEADLARIEAAAGELVAALSDYRGQGDLFLSIADDLFPITGTMDDGTHLYRWLVRLSAARERFFATHQPATSYHGAIAGIRDIICDAGGNVAVHETSRLVRFLVAVEAQLPAAVFPPETVDTPRARYRYVERALKG